MYLMYFKYHKWELILLKNVKYKIYNENIIYNNIYCIPNTIKENFTYKR